MKCVVQGCTGEFQRVSSIEVEGFKCNSCGWWIPPHQYQHELDVARQPHYTQFKIQPITFIEANKLSYSQGNVIKYVCRYKGKNGLEDLKKAQIYLGYLIQELETGEVKP